MNFRLGMPALPIPKAVIAKKNFGRFVVLQKHYQRQLKLKISLDQTLKNHLFSSLSLAKRG